MTTRGKVSVALTDRARALWESGVDRDAEIARRLGVSREAVRLALGLMRDRGPNPVTGRDGTRPRPCGTDASYRRGCRCDPCRTARRLYVESRRRAQGITSKPRIGLVHGTPTGYVNYKCRCDECRAAEVKRQREYKQRRRQREG